MKDGGRYEFLHKMLGRKLLIFVSKCGTPRALTHTHTRMFCQWQGGGGEVVHTC